MWSRGLPTARPGSFGAHFDAHGEWWGAYAAWGAERERPQVAGEELWAACSAITCASHMRLACADEAVARVGWPKHRATGQHRDFTIRTAGKL